jgi:glycosyltransferase involved in cell wall biosynthesis
MPEVKQELVEIERVADRARQSDRGDAQAVGKARKSEHRQVLSKVGVVVIGRNEGERLKKCLESMVGIAGQIVYVDSGSTDGSVEMARAMGVAVVDLDMCIPFSAGRARNEGFRRCRDLVPDLAYVQFVDGDCEVVAGWIEKGVAFLDAHHDVAVVCGRLRERYPERSIYNMLVAIEWDSHPLGEGMGCGGNALIRVDAFAAMNGYRTDLMAGEEPELCIRLRAAGWRIWFVNEPMTLHDAAMTRFGQWWKRSVRAGYGVGQSTNVYCAPPEYHTTRASLSVWAWGLGIPIGVLGLAPWSGGWSLILFLLYALQIVRLAVRGRRSPRENWWNAVFTVLGKFPQMLGQLKFLIYHCLRRQPRLITYK